MAPIGSAIALPPGAAEGVGAHAEPHAELEDARERRSLTACPITRLCRMPMRGSACMMRTSRSIAGAVMTLSASSRGEVVIVAPALAEVADVAGLVADIAGAAPIGHGRHGRATCSPCAAKRDCSAAAIVGLIAYRSAHRHGNASPTPRLRGHRAAATAGRRRAPAARCGCTAGSRWRR